MEKLEVPAARRLEVEGETEDVTRMERSEGILEANSKRHTGPIYQESTWNESEEALTGRIFKLNGKLRCVLTCRLVTDEGSESADASQREGKGRSGGNAEKAPRKRRLRSFRRQ